MHGPSDARPEAVPSNQMGTAAATSARSGHLALISAAVIGELCLSAVVSSDAVAAVEVPRMSTIATAASTTLTTPATTRAGTTLTATRRLGVPGAPRYVTARAFGTTVEVRFRPPSSDGGIPINYYTARCASSNGGVTRQAKGRASPINVRSLSVGKTYTCTVRATNAIGTGPPSAPSASFRVR